MKSTRQRPARHEATEALRKKIVDHEWKPGDQLPGRHDLAAQLGVSYVTVQRSVEVLEQEGFLTSQIPRGTFVQDSPPHLCHFGLIFPKTADQENEDSLFYRSLRAAGQQLQSASALSFHNHFFIDWRLDRKYFEELVSATSRSLYAGLIFATNPGALRHSHYWSQLSVPKVTFATAPEQIDFPSVSPDWHAWLAMAAATLRERGARRIAVLGMQMHHLGGPGGIAARLNAEGLHCREDDIFCLTPAGTSNVVRLLASQPRDRRPDGMLILDDHLAAAAATGLLGHEEHPGIHVVSLVNMPVQSPAIPEFIQLGFNHDHTLQACLTLLRQAPVSTFVPPSIVIKPEFML